MKLGGRLLSSIGTEYHRFVGTRWSCGVSPPLDIKKKNKKGYRPNRDIYPSTAISPILHAFLHYMHPNPPRRPWLSNGLSKSTLENINRLIHAHPTRNGQL